MRTGSRESHPPETDVSWKIPLFRREEGKVQGNLETTGMTAGTFSGKGGEVARYLSEATFQLETQGFEGMLRI